MLHKLLHLYTQPSGPHLLLGLVVLVLIAGLLWLLAQIPIPALFALGIAAEAFSGNWKRIPVPLPIDRVLLAGAVILLLLRGTRSISDRKISFQPIHYLLLAVSVYAVGSCIWFGSINQSVAIYSLIDRLGLLPFLMFTLAPILFGTKKQRDVLLMVLVGLGAYLSTIGLCQGIGLHFLLFPRYINDTNLIQTGGRVGGPLLDPFAMGICVFDLAIVAGIALTVWTDHRARLVCYYVIGTAVPGILFSLTRSVWIGGALGVLAMMLVVPTWRRKVPAVIGGLALLVTACLALIPGLSAKVNARVGNNSVASVWDRYNTNNAALRAVAAHPIFGLGWQEFQAKSLLYFREAATYPLNGTDLEVHNVFLSHLAELGLIGGGMWILAFVTGVGGALVRGGPPELLAWRVGLLGVTVMFVTVANLSPVAHPLPNVLLWMFAGIVASGRHSTNRYEALQGNLTSLPVVASQGG